MVLDPEGMKLGKSRLEDKHTTYVVLMNSGMTECCETFLKNNDTNIEEWESEYLIISGGEATSTSVEQTTHNT